MRSSFGRPQRKIVATTEPKTDETYDLRGLNLIAPDQIMPKGESPWTINSRMYARNEGDSRVANRTRMGSVRLTTAVGETLSTQNIDTGTGDLAITPTRIVAQPFDADADGALTRTDLEIKRNPGATGHVIV